MAKKSKIVKAAKQRELIKKYYKLKEAGDVEALAKLPLDAHPTHYHNVIYTMVDHMVICVSLVCHVYASKN